MRERGGLESRGRSTLRMPRPEQGMKYGMRRKGKAAFFMRWEPSSNCFGLLAVTSSSHRSLTVGSIFTRCRSLAHRAAVRQCC